MDCIHSTAIDCAIYMYHYVYVVAYKLCTVVVVLGTRGLNSNHPVDFRYTSTLCLKKRSHH